ncbi:unnamed protein product [Cylicocyclus nassatus]|uniref:Uncharacterized protein n=1 Tax=Cylicocyclus nassatus TaxID=53992 RepID=A0AA36M5V4_CYLNA|nr:unnamed protein product [Cylicocyclus nassatus]
MRFGCIVILVAVAHCTTTTTPSKEERPGSEDDVITNNGTKITRDSPRIAHDQGSLMATFPVVSRIRSKIKSNTLQARRQQTTGVVSGVNDQMQKLLISPDLTSNANGAFARTPSGTGSSIYTVYGPQTTLTGEPYLSGYRGIPDTHESTAVQPNYVGALTKPSTRKHTFGSYGSIDSVKSQSWQQPVTDQGQYGSSDYNYGPPSFEQPNTFATYSSYNGDYNGYSMQNPYGAAYQGGSDQNYEPLQQETYGTPYSGYGTTRQSTTSTLGSSWPSQSYGSFKMENWQPQIQIKPTTWQLSQYAGNKDNYDQTNSDYSGLKVEQMPMNGYGSQDYGYGTGSGSSYGTDLLVGYSGVNTQIGGYTSGYSKPMSSYKTHNYETPIYGGQQGSTYYGSDYIDDYGSFIDGYQHGTGSSQISGQEYSNPGSTSDYGSGYTPSQTFTSGGSSYQPTGYHNSGYQNPYSTLDFTGYNSNNANDAYRSISRPGVDFLMAGYGAQKGAASAKSAKKLTNNITPSMLVEDGYKTKSA